MTNQPKENKDARRVEREFKLDMLFQVYLGDGSGELKPAEDALQRETLELIEQQVAEAVEAERGDL